MWRSASAIIRSRAYSALFGAPASGRNRVWAGYSDYLRITEGGGTSRFPSSFVFVLALILQAVGFIPCMHAHRTEVRCRSGERFLPFPLSVSSSPCPVPTNYSTATAAAGGAKKIFVPTLYRIILSAVSVPISSFSLRLLRYLFRPASWRAAIRPRQYEPGRDRILPAAATNDQLLPETIS